MNFCFYGFDDAAQNAAGLALRGVVKIRETSWARKFPLRGAWHDAPGRNKDGRRFSTAFQGSNPLPVWERECAFVNARR
jgi:hypothetical protein